MCLCVSSLHDRDDIPEAGVVVVTVVPPGEMTVVACIAPAAVVVLGAMDAGRPEVVGKMLVVLGLLVGKRALEDEEEGVECRTGWV